MSVCAETLDMTEAASNAALPAPIIATRLPSKRAGSLLSDSYPITFGCAKHRLDGYVCCVSVDR